MKVHASLDACVGCAQAQWRALTWNQKLQKKKKCYKMGSLSPVLSLMSPARQARSTKKSKTRWRKGEKDLWSPNRWDLSSWWNRHLHSVQCPLCRAAIVASGTFDFYLGPLWESVTWKQQSRRARYGQGGTLSLAVVWSHEFAWPVFCTVSWLSTLMCVISTSKGSLVRTQGGCSATKSFM
jgi:hypothetical protein